MEKLSFVTISQIAEAAGFSRSAVSLALRRHPSIPVVTQEKIRQAAEDLGWKENPLVSAAMSHRRQAKARSAESKQELTKLALITRWPRARAWRAVEEKPGVKQHALISQTLIEGMIRRAAESGFALEEFWLGAPQMNEKRLNQILRQRNIQGLIIAPVPMSARALELEWRYFSTVTVGYSLLSPVMHRVTTHHTHGMRIALERLREQGYTRPALVMPREQNERVDHLWETGYQGFLPYFFPKEKARLFLPDETGWNEKAFGEWFGKMKPDVIIASGVMETTAWLKKMKISVGKDIGMVNLYSEESNRVFTGIDNRDERIGEEAVDLLIRHMMSNQRDLPDGQKTIMIEPRWHQGETT
jgi:LacI family transcriptional regulator